MLQVIERFFVAGGPIMYPLALIGLLTLTLGLHQAGRIIWWSLGFNGFGAASLSKWWEESHRIAQRRVGLSGMSLLESLEQCSIRFEDDLTRKVPTLRFAAQVSTLMGFLGTVVGMARTFGEVAQRGMATPDVLAGGINEALFTTVFGLSLALLAWFWTHLIESLARHHVRSMETSIMTMLRAEPQ